jgi:sporulation protein YlmC with PRC-barrel domain
LQLSILTNVITLALTELLGSPVFDATGKASGRVREVGLVLQEDRARVAMLIVRTKAGDRVLPFAAITSINGGVRATTTAAEWTPNDGAEGLLLLARDLLDQQVIDVHGRKVVRATTSICCRNSCTTTLPSEWDRWMSELAVL